MTPIGDLYIAQGTDIEGRGGFSSSNSVQLERVGRGGCVGLPLNPAVTLGRSDTIIWTNIITNRTTYYTHHITIVLALKYLITEVVVLH